MKYQSPEEIKQLLERCKRVYATVDLDAIVANMDSMHQATKPGTKIMSVIKTNGYGHGAIPIARELENLPYVFGYAVASEDEAFSLREAGIEKPILILGYTFPYCYEELICNDVRTALFREDSLEEMGRAGEAVGKPLKVHIKVDSGMGRIGITPDEEGLSFVRKVLATKGVELEGIFTHFASADEGDKTYARHQFERFDNFVRKIKSELGVEIPICHCSNSAAIMELPEYNMDMVRAGITMYGLMPSDEVSTQRAPIVPAMSVYSHISFIKTIHAGQRVSYGGLFTATKDTVVATVPVGYGDGYPRMLTGKGEVLIRGKRFPIIGRICMDQFMVDISENPSIQMGDQVTIMGRDGDETISAEEIGVKSGRFNYELACLVGNRVPRVYLKAGKPIFVQRFEWK